MANRGPWHSCSAPRWALALALCALVAALVALAVTLARQPQIHWPSQTRQQNYAQLILNMRGDSSIASRKLDWFTQQVRGTFLGSAFEYNSSSKMLMVKADGLYCVYVQINITRHFGSTEEMNANLTIYHEIPGKSVSPQELLKLPLHPCHYSKKTFLCFKSTLYRLAKNDALYVTISAESKQNGSLTSLGNFFGLFQIGETF